MAVHDLHHFRRIVKKDVFEPDPASCSEPSDARFHADLLTVHEHFTHFATDLDAEMRRLGAKGLNLVSGFVISDIANAGAHVRADGYDVVRCNLALLLMYRNYILYMVKSGIYESFIFGSMFSISSDEEEISFPTTCSHEILRMRSIDSGLTFEQRRICSRLFQIGLKWIMHHELAHIWNGHCDYRLSEGSGGTFLDGQDSSSAAHSHYDYQSLAFELDADSRASHVILQEIGIMEIHSIPNVDLGITRHKNWSLPLLVYQIAITAIFAVLDHSSGSHSRSSHPSPRLRLARHQSRIIHIFSGSDAATQSEVSRILSLASHCVFYTSLSAYGRQSAEQFSTENEEGKTSQGVQMAWNDVFRCLKRHMRGFHLAGPYVNGRNSIDLDGMSDFINSVQSKK